MQLQIMKTQLFKLINNLWSFNLKQTLGDNDQRERLGKALLP